MRQQNFNKIELEKLQVFNCETKIKSERRRNLGSFVHQTNFVLFEICTICNFVLFVHLVLHC